MSVRSGPYKWYQSTDSATTMAIHSNKYNKATQNEEQQSVKMSSESRIVSGTRSGFDGVQSKLNWMNANLEKMCGCFYRLMHDRGKDLDQNSNSSGFREDFEHGVGHRELFLDGEMVVQSQIEKWNRGIGSNFGQIESKTFDRTENQKRYSAPTAMDSDDRDLVITIGNVQYPITKEGLHQIFDSFGSFEIINLCSLENGVVQAQIRFRCSSSAAWARLSRQGRNIYDGCCHMKIEFYKQQQGGMNSIVTEFHEVIEKPNVQFSDFDINNLENYIEHTVFEEVMAEVDTGEVLIEVEVILGNVPGNASNGMDCGADDEIFGAEVGAGCTIVASNINVDIARDNEAPEFLGESWSAKGKMKSLQLDLIVEEPAVGFDYGALQNLGKEVPKKIENEEVKMSENGAANAIIGAEMSDNGAVKNGLLQIIFNDPFYEAIKSVLVNDKMHLLLAVRIAISMVEVKGWLAFECEVGRLELRSQGMGAAGWIGTQWFRLGVG